MNGGEQRVELPPRPASAAEARRFVFRALGSTDTRTREVGVLLTSELVTNALLHAQGGISLRVLPGEDTIRVTVGDDSPQTATPRQVGVDATSGRGLSLVDRLASSWGVDVVAGDGKEVWFELAWPVP